MKWYHDLADSKLPSDKEYSDTQFAYMFMLDYATEICTQNPEFWRVLRYLYNCYIKEREQNIARTGRPN